MRESELFEGNNFVRGIKKIQDRLLAIVRLYDQLRPAHATLAVAWRQTLLLSPDLNWPRKAYLIPLSRFWGPAAIEWPLLSTILLPMKPAIRPRMIQLMIPMGLVASTTARPTHWHPVGFHSTAPTGLKFGSRADVSFGSFASWPRRHRHVG